MAAWLGWRIDGAGEGYDSDQAHPTMGAVRVIEAIRLGHDPATVWALIVPAESAIFLAPETTAKAFSVPGSPEGLGAQQCFIDWDGNASVMEVIEYVEGRRAVAVPLSTTAMPIRTTYNLEPSGEGCVLSVSYEVELPGEPASYGAFSAALGEASRDYLARLKRVLDEG